ncbi:MAG: sigma-54 dependent transcriptional regulator [Desulfonauticus sp.]|nr:sigma-54 dependent transcriptional regulator [Desulfonauticus sp.]
MDKILIIEDDLDQLSILSQYLKQKKWQVEQANTASKGIDLAKSTNPDMVLMDYKLPDLDGSELLSRLKEILPLTPIIIITAFGSIEMAVSALKQGAYHYLTKPINLDELTVLIERGLKTKKLEEEVKKLKAKLNEEKFSTPPNIIAQSEKMKQVLVLVQKVATTEATVLILGESGTGKEIIAELIHTLSLRNNQPLIKVNCAAIPKGLLESELFGHEKGAFTGAVKSKPGLFELANKGTIFLDEIGDMDIELQAKLLRVLQNNSFTRVGGVKEIKVDVRVIAATNKNLEQLVQEQKFREDLFWRLNVFSLTIPPLRERKEDIEPLFTHFIDKFGQKYQKNIQGISRKALELLLTYEFPGNVRELENIAERAVILAEGDKILPQDLPPYLQNKPSSSLNKLMTLPLPKALDELEKYRITEALKLSHGIQTKAAELLGISERTLRYKLNKLGLK